MILLKKKNHIFRKRALAYIIDFIILGIFVSITLLFTNVDTSSVESEMSNLAEMLLSKNINISTYLKNYGKLFYKYDIIQFITNLLNFLYIIILYIIVPGFTEGQTIGKKIMKIRVVNEDDTCVSIINLINRALLVDFLGYLLITLIIINFISGFPYFIIATILGILQFLLVIISGFMILYNKKQKGIHDILTKTKIRVIE